MTLTVKEKEHWLCSAAHNQCYAHFRIMQSRHAIDCRKSLISGGVATCRWACST